MLTVFRMLVCSILLMLSSCASSSFAKQPQVPNKEQPHVLAKDQPPRESKYSWQLVTVKYIDLEGGFYGLISEQGVKLLPLTLPTKYRVDGTTLRVKGQFATGMVTIQQWGKPFTITEIELINIGQGKSSTK